MQPAPRIAFAWVLGMLLGAALAFAWLRASPAFYEASAVVGSAPMLGGGADQSAQEAGQHLGVAVDLMRSRAAALAVIEDPLLLRQVMWSEWDGERGVFRPEPSLSAAVGRWIDRMAGRQPWHPPGPEEVERKLGRILEIGREGEAKLMHVRTRLLDREASRKLIETAVEAADRALRVTEIERLRERLAALDAVARTLGPIDPRRGSVAELRAGISVRLAVLETNAPYAIAFITPPSAPPVPTSPSPLLVVAVLTVAGGAALVLTDQGLILWSRRRFPFRFSSRR